MRWPSWPCAKHCGLTNKQIQSAFDTFKGIRRRHGSARHRGRRDGHGRFRPSPDRHPRDAAARCASSIRTQKVWAVFEPRTNTTRRNVFQTELAAAFADANAVVVAQVARLEQLAAEERLDPEKLMQDLKAAGKDAAYLPDVDAIVAHVAKHAQGGEVVCVFSNGGFGGIHGKLLERLGPALNSLRASRIDAATHGAMLVA